MRSTRRIRLGQRGRLLAATSVALALSALLPTTEAGAVINNITELEHGFLLSMAVSTGASILVLANRASDLALVSFEMAELINRVGHAITPSARTGWLQGHVVGQSG